MKKLQRFWRYVPTASTAALGAVLILGSGCKSGKGPGAVFGKKDKGPLILEPRSNVPAPYIRPGGQAPADGDVQASFIPAPQSAPVVSIPSNVVPTPAAAPAALPAATKPAIPIESILHPVALTEAPKATALTPAAPPEAPFEIQPLAAVTEAPAPTRVRMLGAPEDITEPILPAVPAKKLEPIVAPVELPALPELPKVGTSSGLTHTVEKGDNLWRIGKIYGVTADEIAAHNGISKTATLYPKMALKLPPGAEFNAAAARPSKAATSSKKKLQTASHAVLAKRPKAKQAMPKNGIHEVQKGDSLWKISRLYGVSVNDLKKANGLSGNSIRPGQKLILRSGATAAKPATRTATKPARKPKAKEVKAVVQESPKEAKPQKVQIAPPKDNKPLITATQVQESVPEPQTDAEAVVEEPAERPRLNLPHTITQQDSLVEIAEMYDSQVDWIREVNPTIPEDGSLKSLIGKRIAVPVLSLRR